MNDLTKKRLSELSQMQKDRNATYLEWLKNILTIATALLAVIISLKSEKSNNLIHSFFIFLLYYYLELVSFADH